MNATPRGRRCRSQGGAWNEPSYTFSAFDARTPFTRDDTFGFRCVQRLAALPDAATGPLTLLAAPPAPPPVGDETYRVFAALHTYDKQPLDSRLERTDDSSGYWRRETVSFAAAYPNDRVLAHLFLPKNAQPPYQKVAIMGG